jgi:hypothetical protein
VIAALANPRVQNNGMRLFTAAVAGPALVVAGVRYPGTWPAKTALVLMGTALIAYNTRALSEDVRPLIAAQE